ncbi:MAG: sulfite exporter TauE/SafE family protein [Porticoccaceae bacterium]|jgi:hypothetical protein|nr:sulfite exporter TauE/SafE family protein [Porticoccaceae bacterium]MBT3797809.1 sulfite exporter TauE/SafE family protein [Porticoccaceae bacterium]MBT4164205.1 sulfite exporter TauE/SafE family protein [Porticoccaceae bacterium]MBT4211042.1 sulfite exporter TauE/SafE family protein [Porticoccaceae bacterium]MBT4591951.1 sulfite exporter TauE/SafE family protein [Porticoccaceae bacterium]
MEYLIYLALGAVAGLVSGLFGLGGGALIVPILLVSFVAQGFSPDIATHMAIATSLATIVITSMSSMYTHYQRAAVRWELIKMVIPGILLGSLLGTLIFPTMDSKSLQLIFGLFLMIVGLYMLFSSPIVSGSSQPSAAPLNLGGIAIGALSSLLGIGGGIMVTPFLASFGVTIHRAIGTAAVGGFAIALPASLVYSSADVSAYNLPVDSIGYIFLPAWVGIIITSAPFARFGALIAHRTDERRLKKYFGIVLLFISAGFLWVNLGG